MKNIRRILVVSRLNSYSPDAVSVGVSVARTCDAELTVLHLTSNPIDVVAMNKNTQFSDEDFRTYLNLQQEIKTQLDEIIKNEQKGGFPLKELISDGEPVAAIEKVVTEEKINLIVLLAHQEGHLEHALFGGENDALIRKMPCSILLVKKEPEAVQW